MNAGKLKEFIPDFGETVAARWALGKAGRLLALAALLCVLPGSNLGLWPSQALAQSAVPQEKASRVVTLPPVTVSQPDGQVQFRGVLQPIRQFDVRLPPNHFVEEIYCSNDQRVAKDAPLLKLDSSQLDMTLSGVLEKEAQLRAQEHSRQMLQAETELKRQLLNRLTARSEEIRKISSNVSSLSQAPPQELSEKIQLVRGELKLMQSRLEFMNQEMEAQNKNRALLQAARQSLWLQKSRLAVTAPFAGRVSWVISSPWMVPPGGGICRLVDESGYLVKGRILQYQVKFVQPGMPASVNLEFVSDKPCKGRVVSVSDLPEGQNFEGYPSFPVTVRLDKLPADYRVLSGMSVMVTILPEPKAGTERK